MSFPILTSQKSVNAAIESAFSAKPDLSKRIRGIISTYKQPNIDAVFNDIASYVQELKQNAADGANGPASKKRKLNEDQSSKANNAGGAAILSASWSSTIYEGLSFSVPQRKKLNLEVSGKKTEGIRAINPTSKETEFGIPWKDIEHVVCLPVPEKAQAARNFCVFSKNGDGIAPAADGASGYEPMVWTAADTLAKGDEGGVTASAKIIKALKDAKCQVMEPKDDEFVSEVQQAYRKGEKAYYVKAFRGSKDGFLFFLPNGIIWGFKKPLIFFSFASIDSISYSSILQRTFNLTISARSTSSSASTDAPQEFEFSMVDQADFAGIDSYIKRHKLQDASMAEQRRAKKLNINGIKEAEEGGEEQSELKKAEREAEMQADEEDDEEDDENFDPGSDGESEGSGSGSGGSDDEDEEDGGGGAYDDDGNLVDQELGSEAEDVEEEEDEL